MMDLAAIAAEFTDDPPDQPGGFAHSGIVWRWQPEKEGAAAWFFLVIDGAAADAIRAAAGPRRGFGSIRVRARIGKTDFATSLFPSKEKGGFLLPLKASVRKAERLGEGSTANVTLSLV